MVARRRVRALRRRRVRIVDPDAEQRELPAEAHLAPEADDRRCHGLAILDFLHVDGIDFTATGNGLAPVLTVEEEYPAPLP